MATLPLNFFPLFLACVADDTAGAKTWTEFQEHSRRRSELIRGALGYAAAKGWKRVRLEAGVTVGPGADKWFDFCTACQRAHYILDALLELDCQ